MQHANDMAGDAWHRTDLLDEPHQLSEAVLLFADRLVAFAALCLVVGLFLVQLKAGAESGLFSTFSLVEESAYTYLSAFNFLHFGLLNSGLLQDFSTSPNPLDHPFIYNHMPPGPDLVMAGLLKLSGGDPAFARIALGFGALAGFGVYYLFVKALLRRHGLRFAGLPVLLLGVFSIAQMMERPVTALLPLLAFLPLLLYDRFLITGRGFWFAAALVTAFVSTLYIEYSTLVGVIFCWGFLFLTQLLPMRFRHLVAVGLAFGAGIGLHLLQNFLFLGPDVFFKELWMTVSNRMSGVPGQEEMKAFYRGIGVVHHGSHPIQGATLWAQLLANLKFPGWTATAGMAVAVAALATLGVGVGYSERQMGDSIEPAQGRETALLLGRFALWILGTVWAPILLFPAFAQEVNLRGFGGNVMFVGVGAAAVLSLAVHFATLHLAVTAREVRPLFISGYFRRNARHWLLGTEAGAMAIIRMLVFVLIGLLGLQFGKALASSLAGARPQVASVVTGPPPWRDLDEIAAFSGELFMTNVNVPLVGLLTKAPGFGVCGPASVGQDGTLDTNVCKIMLARRQDYWSTRRPHYFFYFDDRQLFPGFADCLPAHTLTGQARLQATCMTDLLSALSRNYKLVLQNEHVHVFDLDAPR